MPTLLDTKSLASRSGQESGQERDEERKLLFEKIGMSHKCAVIKMAGG